MTSVYKRRYDQGVICLLLLLLLTACNSRPPIAVSTPTTEANSLSETVVAGEALFTANGCVACHALQEGPDAPALGPVLEGVATRSQETIQSPAYTGQADSVAGYLRESILHPKAHIVEGFTPLMPKTYKATLSEADLATLVEFLGTLK